MFVSHVVFAATYYVATNGSDIYTTTQAQKLTSPWKTIKKAASMVVPGDVVLVKSGIYSGDIRLRISGTATQSITFKAYPGDNPIIDLNGGWPAAEGTEVRWWFGVVSIFGDYNVIDGFEIRNGTSGARSFGGGQGVEIRGNHNTVRNCIVRNIQDAGMRIRGSYTTIEENEVYDVSLNNKLDAYPGGDWGSGIAISGNNSNLLTGNVIRNNIVHNVWGEGIYGYYGISNTLLEGNIVYNYYALGLGLSGSRNGIIRNNIIYNPSDSPAHFGGWGGLCIVNDNLSTISDTCINNLVYNNFVYGCGIYVQRFAPANTSLLIDTKIYNNTVINTEKNPIELGGTKINTIVRNNILVGLWNTTLYGSVSISSNNYMSTIPPSNSGLSSATNIIGDALAYLDKAPGSVASGQLTKEWFKLTANSPARDHGISLFEVTNDAFGNIRDLASPDIGAHEYLITDDVSALKSPLFELFPNPGTTNFTVKFSGIQTNERVQIYNSIGILFKELNVISLNQKVNIDDLSNGLYFINLKSQPQQVLKFLKQ